MPKLKLSEVPDDKPVKLTVTLTASQHGHLVAYAHAVAAEQGRTVEPARLVPLILERFIATDRAFARARKEISSSPPTPLGGPPSF